MIYGGMAASALGSLLRKAQEDRQQGPHLIPQSAEAESPIRQQIQGPISAPESVGSEKVVSMKGEMQPIQEGGTFAPGVGGIDNPSVVPPIVPPMSPDMAPVGPMGASPMGVPSAMSAGLASPLLPSSMKPGGSRSVAQGNVLGVSSPNYSKSPNFSPVSGSKATMKQMAPAAPWVEKEVAKPKESFGSNKEWQAAQTKTQDILGGIGKVMTDRLTKLSAPQLIPGGIFKKLQDVMAPKVKDIFFKNQKGKSRGTTA